MTGFGLRQGWDEGLVWMVLDGVSARDTEREREREREREGGLREGWEEGGGVMWVVNRMRCDLNWGDGRWIECMRT